MGVIASSWADIVIVDHDGVEDGDSADFFLSGIFMARASCLLLGKT